jgi:hypothetical protein
VIVAKIPGKRIYATATIKKFPEVLAHSIKFSPEKLLI